MEKLDDTIRVLIPLKVRKKNGRPKILPPAASRPSKDQAGSAHPACHWPCVGLAAAKGPRRVRHHSGIGRGRWTGGTPSQPKASVGLSGARSPEAADMRARGVGS